jgi:MFS transporter, FSR family, fosmidomycin resistance protein
LSADNRATAPGLVWPRFGGPVVVLVSVSSSHAVIHAFSTLMPLVYPLALTELHFSLTALGLMVATANLAGGFIQLASGAVTRVIRRHTLLGLGAVGLALASVVTATSSSFLQFAAGNILQSTLTSPQHPVGNSLLSDLYARTRRGAAIAGHIAGGNIGTLLLTPAAAVLLNVLGWRTAVAVLAIPALIGAAAVLGAVGERDRVNRERSAAADMLEGVRQVWRSRNLRLIFSTSLIGAGGRGLGVVTLVLPLYLKLHLQLSNTTVTELYTLLLLGSVVGPSIGGPLSDRIGRRKLLLAVYPLSTLLLLAVLRAPATSLWLALAITALGLVVFLESPILQTFLADEAPAGERDAIFSLYFAVAFGIGALWAAAIGALLGRLGFPIVFAIMAAAYLVAGTLVVRMREGSRSGRSGVRR